MKLGKKPASYDHRDLLMTNYVDESALLPAIPQYFGHEGIIGDWRMLGNDSLGDCVFAGAGHETMLLSAMGGNGKVFDDAHTIADYSAVTGYNAADPSSDQGTDVRAALDYRRKTGVSDAFGDRHKILGYVALEPGNISHLKAALYLFGAVGIGFAFPNSAMDQFNAGKPWSVRAGARTEGGHYVPLVGWRRHLISVSWGRLQEMTTGFYRRYCDEAWAFVSDEFLQNGKSPEGFGIDALLADLGKL
jgi:hypothetical protein